MKIYRSDVVFVNTTAAKTEMKKDEVVFGELINKLLKRTLILTPRSRQTVVLSKNETAVALREGQLDYWIVQIRLIKPALIVSWGKEAE